MSPVRSLVADHDSDSYIFMRFPRELNEIAPNHHEGNIDSPPTADAPRLNFLTQFSGDATRHDDTTQGLLAPLIRTEGQYQFRSFLAAINKGDRTIVTLGRYDWTVNFSGDYDAAANVWKPDDLHMITGRSTDEGRVYRNVTRSMELPFSLYLDTPIMASEIKTSTGWVRCDKCLPASTEPYNPTDRWWGD